MPELPEVETVIRDIKKWMRENKIFDMSIKNIEIFEKKIVKDDLLFFTRNIINKKIKDISRKGKWIFFHLDDFFLICHLRMTGKFFFEEVEGGRPSIVFTFSDNKKKLFFYDNRKFATIQIKKNEEIDIFLNKIGPDIIFDEINEKYLIKKFEKKNKNIKSALLDQKIICGIGNIYASEILFFCKINPLKISKEISFEEIKKIIFFAKKILKESIELGGTSIIDFISPFKKRGGYQKKLKVYMRSGSNCYECKDQIKNIMIEGRNTYFCPNCQK